MASGVRQVVCCHSANRLTSRGSFAHVGYLMLVMLPRSS
jgi:hypothetical protein